MQGSWAADNLYFPFDTNIFSEVDNEVSSRGRECKFTTAYIHSSRFGGGEGGGGEVKAQSMSWWEGLQFCRNLISICFLASRTLHQKCTFAGKMWMFECSVEEQRHIIECRQQRTDTEWGETGWCQKEVLCRGWTESGPIPSHAEHHRKGLILNGVRPDDVRKRCCVEDKQNRAKYWALWNTTEKAWDLWAAVVGNNRVCSICEVGTKPNQHSIS